MTEPNSPETQIPVFAPGRDLADRYRLIEMLSSSWSEVTWSAYDLQWGTQVALHVLPQLFVTDQVGLQELRQRSERLQAEPHPGLVQGLDYFATAEAAFYVDELLRGSSLAELRHRQPGGVFAASVLVDRLLEACSALRHWHGFGWPHGDLHPGQMLVDAEDRLRLTGLGIAQIVCDVRFPETGAFALMHSCKSPQQIAGEMAAPPDDVYAFGASIFHLLTGQFVTSPHFGWKPGAALPAMAAICERLGLAGRSIDPGWDRLVQECLAVKREARPSVERVAESLRALKEPCTSVLPELVPVAVPPAVTPAPSAAASPPPAVLPVIDLGKIAPRRRPALRAVWFVGSAVTLGLAAAFAWTKTGGHFATQPEAPATIAASPEEPPAPTARLPEATAPAGPALRGSFRAQIAPPEPAEPPAKSPDAPPEPAPVPETARPTAPSAEAQAELALLEKTKKARESALEGGLTLPPLRALSEAELQQIGQHLWRNEANGTVDGLTSWIPQQTYATLGIGRFTWYPQGAEASREETFPDLMQYFSAHGVLVPAWLKGSCPWPNRAAFLEAFREQPMTQLRDLLKANIALQTQVLADNLRRTVASFGPGLSGEERTRVQEQYTLLAKTPRGLFAMIDDLLWQGPGAELDVRTGGAGAGLLQVLLDARAKSADDAADRFSDAAERVLLRRFPATGMAKPDPAQQHEWVGRVRGYSAEW